MLENQSLLKAVLEKPDDDAPRLAYADWCEKQTDEIVRARGEFIRLDIELPKLNYGNWQPGEDSDQSARVRLNGNWITKSGRWYELIKQYGSIWASPFKSMAAEWEFNRGFVAGVKLSAQSFLENGRRLIDAAPIKLISLTEVLPVASELLASPLLDNFGALNLMLNGLTDDHVTALIQSPHLKNLWWLALGNNKIGFAGVEALAKSPHFRQLVFLGLTGNPCDPMESVSVEGLGIQDIRDTPEGELLERKYGPIPWLHYLTNSVANHPPSPFLRPPPVPGR